MKGMSWKPLCLFLLIALMGSPALLAQNTADIIGTVTDSSGAAVPNAKVTVKNTGTNASRSMQASASGDYAFTLLPVGTYALTVEATGFKTYSASAITIAAGDRARVDAAMEVGTVNQVVEVEASAAPLLQTDSPTVGGLLTANSVQELPVNGRNSIRLVQLAPGANEGGQSTLSGGNRPDDRRQTSSVVVNGQNDSSNDFLLDGVDNNERAIATIIVKPSIDAIQEIKIETNMYSAQTGRVGGAVITMVTKSGTNNWHGTAFEFLRNDKFDARDYFNVPQAGNPLAGVKPEYRQNQFGGSFGGPIRKDKTFFFADYEGLRVIQGLTQTSQVPTPCELGRATCNGVKQIGNFSDITTPIFVNGVAAPGNIIPSGSLNPIGVHYANLYPTVSSCTVGPCPFVASPNKTQYFHTGDVRIDQHFGDSDNIFGRYTINNGDSYFPGALPITTEAGVQVFPNGVNFNTTFPGFNYGRQQNVTLGWDHILQPNLILDMRGSPGADTWPNLDASRHGGGNVWIPGSYDPELHLYYFGTGNPNPIFSAGARAGTNLFTCSIIAVNVDTGKMAWYFQPTPHETHDWDAAQTPVLIDAEFRGKQRKLLLTANRSGYFFVLDRVTGEPLLNAPFSHSTNWATGVNDKGQLIRNPDKDAQIGGALVSPSNPGITNYPPPTFDPETGLFYVQRNESFSIYYITDPDPKEAQGFGGAQEQMLGSLGRYLTAIDYKTGKVVWEHPYPESFSPGGGAAGLLSTAGKLLFAPDAAGNLVAYDPANGRILWHTHLGQVSNAAETYLLDGRQYILLAAGDSIYAFALN